MKTSLALPAFLLATSLAQGAVFDFTAILDGPSESPPNASPGTGSASFSYDSVLHTLDVDITFSGLLGTTTGSHIHAATTLPDAGTAGVATTVPSFAGFPSGVTSGHYANTLDLTLASSYNPAFVTANGGTTASAESALFTAMEAGKSYVNIHTTVVPGGEIRGFLTPVPEPAETCAIGAGLLGSFALLRRFRNRSGK